MAYQSMVQQLIKAGWVRHRRLKFPPAGLKAKVICKLCVTLWRKNCNMAERESGMSLAIAACFTSMTTASSSSVSKSSASSPGS